MADRKTIISALEEIAQLLELSGANPFKVRAYQNGARILSAYPGDLAEGLASGELARLKGVGKSLLSELTALIEEGRSPTREELLKTVPPGLLEMVKIPGLGPKKVRRLYDELGISTLGELEYACNENRLLSLPGFGPKSQAKILSGIDILRRYSGRHLLSEVWDLGERLRRKVAGMEGVERCALAGSLRRRRETVKDVDLLVVARDSAAVMEAFCGMEEVEEVIARGETKSSVRLETGIQVDLRVVDADQFPFALAYFTGSKEHNIVMRERARARGYKLNEYGLFVEGNAEGSTGAKKKAGARPRGTVRIEEGRVVCRSEAEIFAALDLAEIPPELREDRGEFEAAEKGELPTLIGEEDLKGVLHNHSVYSDGAATIEAMAKAARDLGWEYLGISDHSRSAFYASGLSLDEIERQHEEIDELNERLDGITILKGIESDILADGSLDYEDEVLDRFDFVVASVHSRFGLDEVQQTQRCIRAVQNPFTTILGHPTGRLLLARDAFRVDMDAVLDAAADSGCVIELNSNPRRLDLDWRYLHRAATLGILVSIGPDAHRTETLADVRYGVAMARKGWLRASDVLNTRGLEAIRAYLDLRRAAR